MKDQLEEAKTFLDSLGEGECGFSISADGEMKFAIPEQANDDDDVPEHVLYVTAIAVLTRHEYFREYVFKKFNEEIDEMEDEDASNM